MGPLCFSCACVVAGVFVSYSDSWLYPLLCVLFELNFAAAMEHKRIILEVAALASAEGRTPFLAVLYDEIMRYVLVS